jgi:hypothetical protein
MGLIGLIGRMGLLFWELSVVLRSFFKYFFSSI